MIKCSNPGENTMDNQRFPRELVAIYGSMPEKNKYNICPRKSISDCLIQRPSKLPEKDHSKIYPHGRGNNPYKFRLPNVIYDRQHKYTKVDMFHNCITNVEHAKTLDTLNQVFKQIDPSLQKNQAKRFHDRRVNTSNIPRNTQECFDYSSFSHDTNLSSFQECRRKSDTTCATGEHSFSKSINHHFLINKISDSSFTTRNNDNCNTSLDSIDDLLKTDSNMYRPKTLSSKVPKHCASDLLFLEDIPTYDIHKERNQLPHSSVKKGGINKSINNSINHPQNIQRLPKVYHKHVSLPPIDVKIPQFVKQREKYQLNCHFPKEYEKEVFISQTQYIDDYGNTYEKSISLPPSAQQEHKLGREKTQEFFSFNPPTVPRQNQTISKPPPAQRPTCIELPSKPQLPVCIQTPATFAVPNIFHPGVQNVSHVTNPCSLQETTQLQHLTAFEKCSQNSNKLQAHQQQYNQVQQEPFNIAMKNVDLKDFLQQKPCSQNKPPVQNTLISSSLFVSQHHPTIETNRIHQNILQPSLFLSRRLKDPRQIDCIPAHTNCGVKQQLLIRADSSRERKYEICNTDEQVQTSDYEQQSCTDQSQTSEILHKMESANLVPPSTNQSRTFANSLKSEITGEVKNCGGLENPIISNDQFDKKRSSHIQTSNSLLCTTENVETHMSKKKTNTEIQVEDIFFNAKPELSSNNQLLQQISDNIILQSTYSSKVLDENRISSGGNELRRTEHENGKLNSPIPWKSTPYPAETHFLEIKIPLNMKQTMNVYHPIQTQYESGMQEVQGQIINGSHSRRESNRDGIDCRQEYNSQIIEPSSKDSSLESKQHDSSMKQPIIIYHKVIPPLTDKLCQYSAHAQSPSTVQKKKRLNVSFKEPRCDNKENMEDDISLPRDGTENAGSNDYELSSRKQSIINCHFINSVSYAGQHCTPEIQVLHNAANTSFSLHEHSDYESTELITLKLSKGDISLKNHESGQKNQNIRDIFLKEDYCEITSIDSNDILLKNNNFNTTETVNYANSLMSEKHQSICEEVKVLQTNNCVSTPDNTYKVQNETNKTHRNVELDPRTLNEDSNMVDNDGTPNTENDSQLSEEQTCKPKRYKKQVQDKQNCLLQYFKRQPAWVENVVTKVTQDLLKKLGVTSNTSISMCHSYTIPLHTLPEEQSRPTTVQMLTEGSSPTTHTLPDGSTCKTSPSNVCVVPTGRKHVKKSNSDTCQVLQQKSSNKYLLLDHVIPQRMPDNTSGTYDDESSPAVSIFQQSLAYTPVPLSHPLYTIMPYTERRGRCRSKAEGRACSTKSTQYSIKSASSVFNSEQPIVLCGCKPKKQPEELPEELPEEPPEEPLEELPEEPPEEPPEVRNDVSVPPNIFAQHTESTIGSIPEPPPEEEFRPSHIFDIIFQNLPELPQSCGLPNCNPSLCDTPCFRPSQPQPQPQPQPTMHEQEPYVRPPDTGPVETTYYPSADQPLRLRIRKGPAPKKSTLRERSKVVREFTDSSGIKRIRHICRRGGRCIGKPQGDMPNIFATKPESTVGVMPYVPVISSVKRRYCRYCTLEICPGEEVSRRYAPRSGVQMMEKELLSTMLDGNPYKRTRCTLDSYSNWEFPTVRDETH